MGFPRKISLRSGAVIGRVIRQGRRYAHDPLKVHVLPADGVGKTLIAFAVPKYGHEIVERNLLKRRLQEIVRQSAVELTGYLAVVRCSPRAYERGYKELKDVYDRLVERISADRR
jgi:ribonuclease P protein component